MTLISNRSSPMARLPLVSVITPSYNQGEYISETIRSVRDQTYPHIEHIVVDAGSTDNTLAILTAAAARAELHFISEADAGMYSGINKGLNMAQGDIVAYLNSDDMYLPWAVETAVGRLEEDPSLGFVFGDAIRYDHVARTGYLVVTPPFNLGFLVRRGFLTQPTVFWRRALTEAHGMFDESLAFVGDCDYWMRLGAHASGARISELLALERDHGAAKRFTNAGALALELDRVRRVHGAIDRPGSRVADRVYAYLCQLWFTAFGVLRAAGFLPKDRFAYKNGFGPTQPSVSRLLASRIPFLGRRVWSVRVPAHNTVMPETAASLGSRVPRQTSSQCTQSTCDE